MHMKSHGEDFTPIRWDMIIGPNESRSGEIYADMQKCTAKNRCRHATHGFRIFMDIHINPWWIHICGTNSKIGSQ